MLSFQHILWKIVGSRNCSHIFHLLKNVINWAGLSEVLCLCQGCVCSGMLGGKMLPMIQQALSALPHPSSEDHVCQLVTVIDGQLSQPVKCRFFHPVKRQMSGWVEGWTVLYKTLSQLAAMNINLEAVGTYMDMFWPLRCKKYPV